MTVLRSPVQCHLGIAILLVVQVFAISALCDEANDTAKWRTFTNRAGWSIKHPSNWKVGSCRSCPDPTDPGVFVSIYSPSDDELLMVEHLIDKPKAQSVRDWLDDTKTKANLNPRIREEWITVAGEPALRVITRNADSTQSEVVYVVHGVSTFQISFAQNFSSAEVCRKMLSTFRFTTSQPTQPKHP
jgi:hypothetical protein